MTDTGKPGGAAVFAYHFFSPKKNLTLRYGIARGTKGPAKAIFLLLHGRSEFVEKYNGIARKLLGKGFQVVSPDWRGQGLSARELDNPHKGHVSRFGDYVEDLEALFFQVVEPLGLPVYILAHSMGGHIALRFMGQHPLKIRKAVLASPMIDILLPPLMKPVIKLISRQLSRTVFAQKYTPGSADYSAGKAVFKGNNLCHDPEKFQILHDEIARNPDLALGGVTWGWLNAAFESIAILEKKDVIDKIITPILILSAQKDSVVSSSAQEKLSRRLLDCRFLSIKGAFHELLFEAHEMEIQVWEAFNRFIAE